MDTSIEVGDVDAGSAAIHDLPWLIQPIQRASALKSNHGDLSAASSSSSTAAGASTGHAHGQAPSGADNGAAQQLTATTLAASRHDPSRRLLDAFGYRLRAGCICFNTDCDFVALVSSSSKAGCWILPAGGIEPGESVTAAMHREVEEEAGLVGRAGAGFPLCWVHDEGKQARTAVFAMRVVGVRGCGEGLYADGGTRKRVWCPLEHAETLLSGLPSQLAAFQSGIASLMAVLPSSWTPSLPVQSESQSGSSGCAAATGAAASEGAAAGCEPDRSRCCDSSTGPAVAVTTAAGADVPDTTTNVDIACQRWRGLLAAGPAHASAAIRQSLKALEQQAAAREVEGSSTGIAALDIAADATGAGGVDHTDRGGDGVAAAAIAEPQSLSRAPLQANVAAAHPLVRVVAASTKPGPAANDAGPATPTNTNAVPCSWSGSGCRCAEDSDQTPHYAAVIPGDYCSGWHDGIGAAMMHAVAITLDR